MQKAEYTTEELANIRDHYVEQMRDLGIWTGMENDSHDDWRKLNDENKPT